MAYEKDKTNELLHEGFDDIKIAIGFDIPDSKFILIFFLSFINESKEDKNVLFYGSKTPSKILFNSSSNLSFVIFDLKECELKIVGNSNLTGFLSPYLKYFNKLHVELDSKKEIESIEVNLDFLRLNYPLLDKIIPDEDLMIIPIIGNRKKIKSINLKTIDFNQKTEDYDFYQAKIDLLTDEDMKSHLSSLQENGILLPSNNFLVLIDLSELDSKSKFNFKKTIMDDNISKCFLKENIEGDKIRLKRIIEGIEYSLSGMVANRNLVNIICKNEISSIIPDLLNQKKHKKNENYINHLVEAYPTLANNLEQLNALDKIIHMKENNIDIMLVQGPPGTGKTELILALAKELLSKNNNTLITSNVHVACDNVVERLKNNKDIVLKRYTTLRGDHFNREVIENQVRYVNNQVLSGFLYKEKSIYNKNTLTELKLKINEINNIKQQMLNEKADYEKNLIEYNELNNSIESTLKENNELNLYRNEMNLKKSYLSNKINQVKEMIIRINNQIGIYNQDITNFERKIDFFSKERKAIEVEINRLYSEINSLKDRIHQTIVANENKKIKVDLFKSDANEHKTQHDFLQKKSIESLKEDLLHNLLNGESFATKFHSSLFKGFKEKIKFLTEIKTLLSNDKIFISEKSRISNLTFQSLYFKLAKYSLAEKYISNRIISSLDLLNLYAKASRLKKFFMKLFPFFTINNFNDSALKRIDDQLNNKLKDIYYNFERYITEEIEELNLEKHIQEISSSTDREIKEISRQLVTLEKEIEENEIEINSNKLKISRIYFTIDNESKLLLEKNKDISTEIELKEKILNELSSNKGELNELNELFSKEMEDFDKLLREIVQNDETMAKLNDELDNKKTRLVKIYNKNKEYIDGYNNFLNLQRIGFENLEKNLVNLNYTLKSINDRIYTLQVDGWSEEEVHNTFSDYTNTLIKLIDKENKSLDNFLTGKSSIFRNMFLPTENTKGSLISMTTNQVATLLRSVEKDELTFDYAIVDEASKCSFEDLIISLPRIKHLVLIGDFMQLDPIYEDYKNIDLSYKNILNIDEWDRLNKSSFSMLLSQFVKFNHDNDLKDFDTNPSVSAMKKQYRMNKQIFEIIKPIYSIHPGFALSDEKNKTSNDLMCVDIDGVELKNNTSFTNEAEGQAVIDFLNEFKKNYDKYSSIKSIGIITGYRAQQNYITRKLKIFEINGVKISFGTFDKFQGREFDLVVVSLVRTNSFGFTNNIRRMNVAFSRAKEHLIIFGNIEALNTIARNSSKPTMSGISKSEAKELNYVMNNMIPTLYQIKKKFSSAKERTDRILEFLLKANYVH